MDQTPRACAHRATHAVGDRTSTPARCSVSRLTGLFRQEIVERAILREAQLTSEVPAEFIDEPMLVLTHDEALRFDAHLRHPPPIPESFRRAIERAKRLAR